MVNYPEPIQGQHPPALILQSLEMAALTGELSPIFDLKYDVLRPNTLFPDGQVFRNPLVQMMKILK